MVESSAKTQFVKLKYVNAFDGTTRQGGVLSALVRGFYPAAFQRVEHTDGHGWLLFQVQTTSPGLHACPREIFENNVQQMLAGNIRSTPEKSAEPVRK